MIVKSATGDVDLGQPENVRRGMVFRVDGAPWVATQRDEYFGWGDSGVWCGNPGRDFAFLGCDPARADRADCERFGLAPGIDAGAAGFARTRDGFAVDLRRCATLGIVKARGDFYWTCVSSETLREGERFIGLHAAHARPEDVERLCCGARMAAYEDHLPAESRCTLAIGHDGDHEGVKWAAKETGQACPDTRRGGDDLVLNGTVPGDWIHEPTCVSAPDFKVSTAWADADIWPLSTTWSVVAFEDPQRINLTPQAAALRAALPAIDALPWPAADKRALRDAAHAVCEMAEATDGKAPAGLRGPVTEMLAALTTAAHVGPGVIGEAVKARDAARAAMPRRTK